MAYTSSSSRSTTASTKAQHTGDKAPAQYVSLAQVTYNSQPPPPPASQQPLYYDYKQLPKSSPLTAKNQPQKDRLPEANKYYDDVLGPSGIKGIDDTGRKSPDGQRSSDLGHCQTGPTCETCGSALSFVEIGGFCQSCGYAT